MKNEAGKPNRRSIRLPAYNYSQPGAYFLTICSYNRLFLFGDIQDGKMILNGNGLIVHEEWQKTTEMRLNVVLDTFVIMPNHIHGIPGIKDDINHGKAKCRGTMHRAPTPMIERFGKPVSNSIPTIIRGFKSAVTHRINEIRQTPGAPIWQRKYYEHVIRNEDDLNEIRQYIENNSAKWLEDENHPENIRKKL
jgi:REP element-mobilizing transposase RayT